MARIVIEVADDTAKRWRLSSKERKARIEQIINIKLTKELTQDSPEEFKKFLDEIGQTMEERGLNEEILNEEPEAYETLPGQTMKRIVLEVRPDTAEMWRSVPSESKQEISQIMDLRLTKELLRGKQKELIKAMDKLAKTAKDKGLTEEILQEILAKDD